MNQHTELTYGDHFNDFLDAIKNQNYDIFRQFLSTDSVSLQS